MRLMPRKRRFWKAWPERAPRFSFCRPGLAPGPRRRVSSFRQCGGYRPSQPTPGVPAFRRDDVTGDRDSHNSAFSRTAFARVLQIIRPKNRGRREDRVRAAPAVSRANADCKKRTRAYRFSGSSPAFPAQWFYGLISCSPRRDRACLPPSSPRCLHLKNLTPATGASGPHDFAVRFSHARQSQLSRPPHPTARFVTCATPLSSGGMATEVKVICPRDQR